MTGLIDPIPDDLPACQERLRTALERIRDLERQLDELVVTTEELQRSYDCLKEELLALKRLLFGPRRERLPEAPGQQHLFDTDVPPPVPDLPTDPEPDPESPARGSARGMAEKRSPTTCRDRMSSMMSPPRSKFAPAAAPRPGSVRT